MFAGNRANFCIGFNHGSAVAVGAPRTHQFFNLSAIAAPSSRIAAFNIVVGTLAGKWLHFGGCSDGVTLLVLFAALVWAAFLSVLASVSGSSFLGKP
ncbi:hypothetical protein [Photobacterium kagoshimensis]|uniref:hypothetical protein n=1 Tax=Photobacterium kagoshimensis TaxID=2910242 RepID=UPI003D0F481F